MTMVVGNPDVNGFLVSFWKNVTPQKCTSAVHRADHLVAEGRLRPARAQEPHLRLHVADLGQPIGTVEALHQVPQEEQARLLRQRRPLGQGRG